jgi:hypothetical protein
MEEERGVLMRHFSKHREGLIPVALHLFESEPYPFDKYRIEHFTYTDQCRPSKSSVIIQPSSYPRITFRPILPGHFPTDYALSRS